MLDDKNFETSIGNVSSLAISSANTNLTTLYGLQNISEGINVPLNTAVPLNSRPEWLDENKLKLGRGFAVRHFIGIIYAEMLSLVMILSLRGPLESVIYTGKSCTPYKAFKRYLATVTLVNSWYEGDVWEEDSVAQRSMSIVRNYHLSVAKRMNETPEEQLAPKVSLEGRGHDVWSTYNSYVRKDFESYSNESNGCPFSTSNLFGIGASQGLRWIYFNQLEMSISQFGFSGLMILFPERFGAHSVSEEELEGFVHLWRGLGYILGIEDRYNFCSGNLEETKKKIRGVLEVWIKPQNFKRVTREWEHMFRCVVEGSKYYFPVVDFGSALAYLCWVIDLPAHHLHAVMSWKEWFLFNVQWFFLCYAARLPWVLSFLNWLLRKAMERVRNASPSWHQSKQNKVYDYQKKPKSFYTYN